MGRSKLKKFAELEILPNYIHEPEKFKGSWNKDYFNNENPIVLELGCGKGEYTNALAKRFPDKNFIGIDIKGDRLWRGAKNAVSAGLLNVGFVKLFVENSINIFEKNEISEIWIPFPDPYPRPCKWKRRLTSPRFLDVYKQFLISDGLIHFKTDNNDLYDYTLKVIQSENHHIIATTTDLYNSDLLNENNSTPSYFESIFREQGLTIKYLLFKLKEEK